MPLLFSQQRWWLIDEPFSGLDQHWHEFFMALLIAHCQKGGVVIIASHLTPPKTARLQHINLGYYD